MTTLAAIASWLAGWLHVIINNKYIIDWLSMEQFDMFALYNLYIIVNL